MSIDVRDISHTYNKGTSLENTALKNVSLKIDRGDFVGIVGGVGSGKSTLIRHFNGLLKPDSGEVLVDGTQASEKKVKAKVGMLFQHPENQLFCRNIYEDIAFGPSNFGIKGKELEERVSHACEIVGLDRDMLERSPFALSGGQMRRAALAGILAIEPEYLILDEPTSGLDPLAREELLSRLKSMHERGTTIVVVSHQIEDILPIARKIVLMNRGRIEFYGSPEEYISSVESPLPAITRFMLSLKEKGFDVECDVYDVGLAFEQIREIIEEKRGIPHE